MDAMPQTAVQNENLHTCSIIVDDAQDFFPHASRCRAGRHAHQRIDDSANPHRCRPDSRRTARLQPQQPRRVYRCRRFFFAARILVLGVRRFHLDVSLLQILKTANKRACRFAEKHRLFFTPAQAELSLNKHKNRRLLTIETEHEVENKGNPVANSLAFVRKLHTLPL